MNKQHWHPAFCGAAEWELKKKVRRDKNMCEALRDLMKDEIAAERAAERSAEKFRWDLISKFRLPLENIPITTSPDTPYLSSPLSDPPGDSLREALHKDR